MRARTRGRSVLASETAAWLRWRVAIRNARSMRIAGVLPEDAPDPRLESARRLLGLRFPLMALAPQPTIEDADLPAIMEATDNSGRSQFAVSFSYTLWRNPDDRADPVNFKDLDPEERSAIETVPPWPRPAWLVELVEMMRYPRLWEAVRTSWTRDGSEYTTLERQLVDHTNHILVNQFREELGLAPGPTEDDAWMVRPSSVTPPPHLRSMAKMYRLSRSTPIRSCMRSALGFDPMSSRQLSLHGNISHTYAWLCVLGPRRRLSTRAGGSIIGDSFPSAGR